MLDDVVTDNLGIAAKNLSSDAYLFEKIWHVFTKLQLNECELNQPR